MWIRTVKTKSESFAIQVVSKHHGKLTIHKHIGSYKTEREKIPLIFAANIFIRDHDNIQQNMWEHHKESLRPTSVKITQSQPLFLYRLLAGVYEQLGLNSLGDEVIKDLILARLYQPVSKRETVDILTDTFGKQYSLKTVYRHLKQAIDKGIKEKFQTSLIQFAKDSFHDDLRLVFYDVTTLAFDSQAQKGLKEFGFSKDHRPLDTQIVIGLVVNKEGFPLYFAIFKGSTFEGHTFIPVVKHIQQLLGTKEFVVIADAAMISKDNIEKLDKEQIGFIVGARLANLPEKLIDTITSVLKKTDGEMTTVSYRDHRLLCHYSEKRAAKDKSDRQKQVKKAEAIIATPSAVIRRYRFLQQKGEKLSLNTDLVTKAEKLEGIKGYLTNTDLSDTTIIERYHDLWRIEKSFRITKSDLEARPIFHQLDETIKAHMVIVFAGLAISRFLEIKTRMSIHQILKVAQKVLTHKVTIVNTGEIGLVETSIEDPVLCGQLEKLRHLGY